MPTAILTTLSDETTYINQDGKLDSSFYANPYLDDDSLISEKEQQLHKYLKLILTAKVYAVATTSPITHAKLLSNTIGSDIYLKREDLQPNFSFKCRGAYNRLAHMTEEQKKQGVIACSAGNHAQGLALAAKTLSVKAIVVMPAGTPAIKYKAVERLGATVILHGADLQEAKLECLRISENERLIFVPPFDDPLVIAGQGTVGLEILRQLDADTIEAIFVPIGGGGLISGVAAYVKSTYPHIKVIGVNCVDSDAMKQAFIANKPVLLPSVNGFSDGTAVREIGAHCYSIAKHTLDGIVLVTTDEICAAVKDIFLDTRSVMEPAGAMSVAGIKKWHTYKDLNPNLKAVAILSGANMNFERTRFIAERAELGKESEALIAVKLKDIPGAFFDLYSRIAPRSVTGISYRYRGHRGMGLQSPTTLRYGHVTMSFAIQPSCTRQNEIEEVFTKLREADMQGMDLCDNEMAKTHLRDIVGGRSAIEDERIFAFTFPEKPMALYSFLESLAQSSPHGPFNLTLLSYRNYGGDIARVLVGIQVPSERSTEFNELLHNVGVRYKEETGNEAYKWFLSAIED